MILVDLNILLYAVNRAAAHHGAIRTWWENALNGDEPIGLAWIVLLGFLRLATRVFPQSLTVDEALGRVDAWISHPNTRVIDVTEDQWAVLQRLVRHSGAAGNLTTDAHLAALAITHRAKLVSCDNDFTRFTGLRWENPLAD